MKNSISSSKGIEGFSKAAKLAMDEEKYKSGKLQ